MTYKGRKFSDKLIEKAAIFYKAAGRKYIYKRNQPLPDGTILVDVYETFDWTGCTPKIATIAYKG